jgi:hypothetical protein
MENGLNSKRTANGATAEMKGKKKCRWPCKTKGCPKQAQSGCRGLCKNCYHEFSLNQPQSDSTQGAENLASLGNHGSNNATVSLQRGATLFHRCVSIPSMAYVASLEKRINDMETQMTKINQNLDRRILYLEHLMRDRTSLLLNSHSFSLGQDNLIDFPTDFPTGLSYFSSLSQATSNNPPRNRTSRTHQHMLTRCVPNEYEMPNAGLRNTSVICYANAIFQALATFNHLTTMFNDPLPDNGGTFPLNQAFCTVLHSMVMRQRNPELVVDPSNFVALFTDCHRYFKDVEKKFSYNICVFLPCQQIHFAHDILTI